MRQVNVRQNVSPENKECVLRSSLLNHMAREHSFGIGLPDNIVYCDQFLEVLQGKLDK